jgi:hypothetical protein
MVFLKANYFSDYLCHTGSADRRCAGHGILLPTRELRKGQANKSLQLSPKRPLERRAQPGNSRKCGVDAAGQLNSMLSRFKII